MAQWTCPNCQWKNVAKWANCAKCGIDRRLELDARLRDAKQEWTPIIESHLVTGEVLIEIVPDLLFDSPTESQGLLALTTYRLIAVRMVHDRWKWLHISAINAFSETPVSESKPDDAYRANISLPDGTKLAFETRLPDAAHGEQVASILVNAFMRFATRKTDNT